MSAQLKKQILISGFPNWYCLGKSCGYNAAKLCQKCGAAEARLRLRAVLSLGLLTLAQKWCRTKMGLQCKPEASHNMVLCDAFVGLVVQSMCTGLKYGVFLVLRYTVASLLLEFMANFYVNLSLFLKQTVIMPEVDGGVSWLMQSSFLFSSIHYFLLLCYNKIL